MKSSAAGAEGGLLIRVKRADTQSGAVSIHSTRPLSMPQVFAGNQPEQLLTTLPLIYSVCGRAQGCAAVEAIEQATGISPSVDIWQARRLLVWFETAREHLWRILLDWAEFLGEVPERESIRQITGLMSEFQQALFPGSRHFLLDTKVLESDLPRLESLIDELQRLLQEAVFYHTPKEWLQLESEQELSDWMADKGSIAARMLQRIAQRQLAGLGRTQVRPLPELDLQVLDHHFISPHAERFIAQPTWQGEVRETGPFTRQAGHPLVLSLGAAYGNGLLPRLTARLVELATIPERLATGLHALRPGAGECRDDRGELPPGVGIAQLEASRGRLIHRVVMDEGRISRYQILAPTEWNFHRQGVLAGGLAGLEAANEEEFRWKAELLVNTIDPCVGYDLALI